MGIYVMTESGNIPCCSNKFIFINAINDIVVTLDSAITRNELDFHLKRIDNNISKIVTINTVGNDLFSTGQNTYVLGCGQTVKIIAYNNVWYII